MDCSLSKTWEINIEYNRDSENDRGDKNVRQRHKNLQNPINTSFLEAVYVAHVSSQTFQHWELFAEATQSQMAEIDQERHTRKSLQ